MRSPSRRLFVPAAVLALTLFGAACSSSNTTSTGTGSTAGGTGPKSTADFEGLKGKLPGSGATFPKKFYDETIADFKSVAPGLEVTYGGGGSSKGKQDLADQIVVWAGTDSTIKDEELGKFKGGTVLYFPTVAAPITVSYKLSGVSKLQLSPETLAKIMQRDIKTWNDAAIAADNPGVTLPSTNITVVHRSDGSGTTSNFTKYLDAAAKGTWTLGAGDTVNWPADTVGGNGNGGVATEITNTDGAVGYVDLADANQKKLTTAAIKNADGQYVGPTLEGATAALAGAEVKPNLTYNPLNAKGAGVYPITAPTWIITYQKQANATDVTNVKGWLSYVLNDAQGTAKELDFAPLPSSLQQQAVTQLNQITS